MNVTHIAQHLLALKREIRRLREAVETSNCQQEGNRQPREEKNEVDKQAQPPIIPIEIVRQEQARGAEADHRDERTAENIRFGITTLVQMMLVGVSFLAFLAAAYYASVAKQQLGTMENATKQTERAADAATNAVETARDVQAARLIFDSNDNSACNTYIGTFPATSETGNFKIRCMFKIKNVGSTLAQQIDIQRGGVRVDLTQRNTQPNVSRKPTPDVLGPSVPAGIPWKYRMRGAGFRGMTLPRTPMKSAIRSMSLLVTGTFSTVHR